MQNLLFLDVTLLSMGMKTADVMTEFIETKHHLFPRRGGRRSRRALTISRVFSSRSSKGEHAMTDDNNLLWKFHLDVIPPVSCGVPQVEVTFDIDAHRNRFANESGGGTV